MPARHTSMNGTLVQTSLLGRLWRISAKCAISKCLTPGVHSGRHGLPMTTDMKKAL